ncbi:PQQ-dependent sugar dehydrogenase [Roseisolibacter sp. H3M3-2]|uniref:PQQ-dependent sugar dehydrogenase n=1 Tax=Roseisolibacter sp. H3M3-2 TaxID=3031323 RepID=UPI0023D9D7D1|nr:PQQ-dependent sugar dehydrogenase [Roseisolibacter sp. H3M3-2]MDF1502394.1 PQQ-dependent sugar dehydrogenase [Roseisolibacter sp. H3M3-2]
MRPLVVMALLALPAACGGGAAEDDAGGIVTPPPPPAGGDTVAVRVRTLVSGLDTPWDLAWGPDGRLWVAERGGRISRVDPATGARETAGTLAVTETGESGLLGVAFHPDAATTQPFLYAFHSYGAGGGIRNRLVRMRVTNGTLGAPEPLLQDVPGGTIHDGARLAVGPDRLLYVTTGDAGNESLAQQRASLAGKVLRLTLDGAPAPGNPFGTAVWTTGHRNAQGLAFHPRTGVPYASEHGPGDNDEVNLLRAGANYGWPTVRGRCDGDAGAAETAFCQANAVAEPLTTWTPTVAPAALVVYDAAAIPQWRGSLLLATLKDATLYRLSLSADGATVTGREALYRGRWGRLRALLVGPRGEVYLGTSNRDGRGSPTGEDDRILVLEP